MINGITSQVELSSFYSELSEISSINGIYRHVAYDSCDRPIYQGIELINSITVDGECPIQGTEDKISGVFGKIQRAIRNGTGRATLNGKDLIIETGK